MEISVKDAAQRLGVDPSRIRQMLRAGDLAGRQIGREWLVAAEDVARLESQRRPRGRPLGPLRAWGLLDLLVGGDAPWLSPVARSQVRGSIEKLEGADADRWRAVLRGRSDVLPCQAHPSAVPRLLIHEGVHPAGEDLAVERGFDLVIAGRGPDMRADPVVNQVYVEPERWPALARALAIREAPQQPNLLVMLPKGVWPFEGRDEIPDSVLAADLLESPEPRAVRAGALKLNDLARAVRR